MTSIIYMKPFDLLGKNLGSGPFYLNWDVPKHREIYYGYVGVNVVRSVLSKPITLQKDIAANV